MKKYFKYLLIILIPALLNSCDSEFLNLKDPNAFDVYKFYQSEQDMDDALLAAYQATRSFYNWMFFATEMKSDNATTFDSGTSSGLYYTFVSHQVTSNNTIVANIWNGLYNTIYKTNLVLKHIDKVKMSDESRERIIAEAKFLRGLSHFYLVRLYGPVPVVDKVVETITEANAMTRQPISDAYTLIISDLEALANSTVVPTFYDANNANFGRATSTAGAALLGRVYLHMAATQGKDEYYTNAITYLQKAITLKGYDDFPAGSTYPRVFGTSNEGNEEIIFQCMYLSTSSESSPFAQYFQPLGLKGLTSQIDGRGFNAGQENLFLEYETGDRRTPIAIMKAPNNHYYTKKYVDLSNSTGYHGNNWIEIRFADVFLMLAEAYEKKGMTNEAKSYLDKVRVRASLPKYDASNAAYHTKYPTLRDAIFHERRVELSFENQRWFDLRRMYPDDNDFVTFMQSVEEPNVGNKYTGFKAYEILLPLPYDEVFLNKNLNQNDGY